MPTPIRLAIIGAGSATFSIRLVCDICLTEELAGSSICLMDVHQGRLDTIAELARRYAREMGTDLRFEQTLERETALHDADFVINTALAGGHEHEEAERSLLEQHGYYRGVHLADYYRQFDLMLGVARDMERLCPEAWLIQSSNPVFEGCTLMTRETGIKVLGLCHGHYGYREIARVLGLELEHVTFEAPGFNHCIWMTQFRYKGKDAYPLLDEWIANESERYWETWQPRFSQTQMSPAAIDMYRLYGLMPIGDASRALWAEVWWYQLDEASKRRWWGPIGGFDSRNGWGQYLVGLNRKIEQLERLAADPKARVTEAFPPQKSGEQIVPIINALRNAGDTILISPTEGRALGDRPQSGEISIVSPASPEFQVNVPNCGALAGVPEDVVVEVPALIDSRGIRPMAVGRLPEPIMLGVMQPRLLAAERSLAAFLTGDRRYLMQLLMSDNRTRTWEQAEGALNALMAMPGNEAMAAHYECRGHNTYFAR